MATGKPLSIRAWRAADDHESLFMQRYRGLMASALQLTRRVRHEAEDLVHEAFVQFTLARPDLDGIVNLDGYLYGMLRNLRLSHMRRALRVQTTSVNVLDYDSAELSIRHLDARMRVQMRDDLARVCAYACERSQTSRAGSVLILRFIHGYYPEEIARILRSRVRAVDDWLRIARQEARAALEGGHSARAFALNDYSYGSDGFDVVEQVRRGVFAKRHGACQPEDLASAYEESADGPRTLLLAHIVTCRACLDVVNQQLGLAPLSDRYPTDTLGPGSRSGGNPSAGAAATPSEKAAARGRRREVVEHRPKELHVTANGLPVGWQTIGPGINRQTLAVSIPEPLGFVEAFSEQGLRLLLVPIDPPPAGPCTQQASVVFGDSRLELSVDFSGERPMLRASLDAGCESLSEAALPSIGEFADHVPAQVVRSNRRWWWWSLAGPVFAALMLAAGGWWLYTRAADPGVAVLLADAVKLDAGADPAMVVHRTLLVEARNAGDDRVIDRRRIEIWEDRTRQLTARRLFDAAGRQLAGEWTDGSQRVTLLEPAATPRLQSLPRRPATPAGAADLWRYGSSPVEIAALVERLDLVRARSAPSHHEMEFRPSRDNDMTSWLVHMRVRLASADRRLIEVVWTTRSGATLVEYRTVHSGRETVRRDRVPSDALAVDSPPISQALPAPAAMSTAAVMRRLPSIELETLRRLHDTDACLGEQIAVARTLRGTLLIDGIVDVPARKAAIVEALKPLAAVGLVEVRVTAATETSTHGSRDTGLAVRRIAIDAGDVAAHDILRRYFLTEAGLNGANPAAHVRAVDDRIREFADGVLRRSRTGLLHVWALKRLDDRFAAGLRAEGGAEAARTWRALTRDHLLGALAELSTVRDDLRSVFQADAAPSIVDDREPAGPRIERLLTLTSRIDADVRAALTRSADQTGDLAVQADGFWQALSEALAVIRTLDRSIN